MLTIVGECDQQLFGMKPAERLGRQCGMLGDRQLIAHASAVLSDDTIAWLADHIGTVITSPKGRPLAVVVEPAEVDAARMAIVGEGGLAMTSADAIGPVYVRKLRRMLEPLALSLADQPRGMVERKLFASVYKGVTDVVTKYAWPEPALWLTRGAAALGLSPNIVTVVGLILTFVAGWQFYVGNLAVGMAAAWLMTLLDTVDGKLARCTGQSSKWGNIFDHGVDLIHPPFWWWAWAEGLKVYGRPFEPVYEMLVIGAIVLGYVAQRIIEGLFMRRYGMHIHVWRRIDSQFRLITARRNPNMVILVFCLALGLPDLGIELVALWTILSLIFHAVRLAQANALSDRGQPIVSWLG